MNFKDEFKENIDYVNNSLELYLPIATRGQDEVVEAMKYSLMIGGKRLRPVFCIKFAEMFGAKKESVMPFAAALEFVHTYSLIHDDLPCMDNDDLRRGKPSCHKKFGESTALLAGDALLTHAFSNIALASVSAEQKIKAVYVLAEKAGVSGMIGGQVIDLKYEAETPNISQIEDVHLLKTGCLIEAACLLGAIGGNASDEDMTKVSTFATNLGMSFQIQDDILDVIGDEKKLGKTIGSDADNNKTTYVSLVGIEQAKKDVEKYTEIAISAIKEYQKSEFLTKLAEYLINREF